MVLATGTIGNSLDPLEVNVCLSTDGGMGWMQVLRGPYLYSIGDHGGIIVAVRQGEPTTEIK